MRRRDRERALNALDELEQQLKAVLDEIGMRDEQFPILQNLRIVMKVVQTSK